MGNNSVLITNLIDKIIEVGNDLTKEDIKKLTNIKENYSTTTKDTRYIVYIAKGNAEDTAKDEWYNWENQNKILNILSNIIAKQTGENADDIQKTLVNASADSDKSSNAFLSFLTWLFTDTISWKRGLVNLSNIDDGENKKRVYGLTTPISLDSNDDTKKIPRIYKIFDFYNEAKKILVSPSKNLTPIRLKIEWIVEAMMEMDLYLWSTTENSNGQKYINLLDANFLNKFNSLYVYWKFNPDSLISKEALWNYFMDNKKIDEIVQSDIFNHFFTIVDYSMKYSDSEIQKLISDFCVANNINIIQPKIGSEFNEKTMLSDKHNGEYIQEVTHYGFRINNEIWKKAEVRLTSSKQ